MFGPITVPLGPPSEFGPGGDDDSIGVGPEPSLEPAKGCVELAEQLRGQLRTLQDQVDLATITMTITPSPRVVPRTGIDVDAWVASDREDPCLGHRETTVESDGGFGVCLEIENRGETTLTDFEVEIDPLRRRMSDMTVVEGDPGSVPAGERLVLVTTVEVVDGRIEGRVATRGLDISVTTTAVPVDEDGQELASLSELSTLLVVAEEDDSLPGFGDAVGGGLAALGLIGSVLLVIVGVVLPFVPLIGIVAYVVLRIRRRRRTST